MPDYEKVDLDALNALIDEGYSFLPCTEAGRPLPLLEWSAAQRSYAITPVPNPALVDRRIPDPPGSLSARREVHDLLAGRKRAIAFKASDNPGGRPKERRWIEALDQRIFTSSHMGYAHRGADRDPLYQGWLRTRLISGTEPPLGDNE